ncbi:transposase [Paraburkholderia nemoris]|uniref:transposase n=1 Tax=Paraburkholderia nemoris TaxID=2793076 RepID=UPI0038BC7487
MAIYTLDRGLVIRNGDAQWQIQRVLDQKYVQLEHAETGRIRREKISKLASDITSGKVSVVRDAEVRDGVPSDEAQAMCAASMPKRYEEAYERAHTYLRYMRKQGITKGQRSRIAEGIARVATATGDKNPPSTSTVMLWMRRFDTSGCNPSSLISHNAYRRRKERIPGEVRRVIDKMLSRHYFRRGGSSLRTAHDRVIEALQQTHKADGTSEEPPQVSLSTVRRIASLTTPFDRDRLRLGPAEARNKWRFSKPGKYSTRPLERVELDHTLLDIWVIDDKWGIPLGRPTITLLVCSYSGYIVGFFISFEGETISRVIQSIKVAIQPKDAFTSGASLSNPWYAMGLWETLVVDNALSVHAPQWRRITNELCIDLEYCPVRMPWFKPFVERYLGELTRQLPAPGRPQKPGRHPDPVDPSVTACITFSDLCSGILKWIVDVHPFEINERKQARPVDLFLEGLESCPAPSFCDSLANLDVLAGRRNPVTVSQGGVIHEWIQYVGDELRQMHREIGTNFRTMMTSNPYELGSIFVQHPKTGHWVCAPAKDEEYAAGLSRTQQRLIRARAGQKLTIANAEMVLRRARLELQDHWAAAIRSGRKIKRGARDLALFQGLSSVSSRQASDRSLQTDMSSRLISEDDAIELDRPIPTFEAFSEEAI